MAPDTSNPLEKLGIKRIQVILGTLLYYARQVDPTMLVAIITIAAAQSKGTEATSKAVEYLLDYCAFHPTETIRYTPSNMLLKVHSNALYLLVPEARSRAGGYFFLGCATDDHMNGPLLVVSTILCNVMVLAAEVELGTLFVNVKETVALRVMLEELGHLQPVTPIQVDNSTSYRIVNSSIQQWKSKAIDMHFYWVQDCVCQGQFRVYWEP
eukprot:12850804-Ditylum_brightwellii.AAC.1